MAEKDIIENDKGDITGHSKCIICEKIIWIRKHPKILCSNEQCKRMYARIKRKVEKRLIDKLEQENVFKEGYVSPIKNRA
jgi:hypothetical protein